MREFYEWAARADQIRADDENREPPFHNKMRRVLTPSALNLEGSLFRVTPPAQMINPLGTDPQFVSVLLWPDTSNGGMMQDQVLAAQFGAVISLALDRRIEVAPNEIPLSMEGSDVHNFMSTQLNDAELYGPIAVDPKLAIESTVGDLLGLQEYDRKSIGSAINLHYASTLLLEKDLHASYALAVAGLESLATAYGSKKLGWDDWDEANEFDGLFVELEITDRQADALRNRLLKGKHLKIRQTFASYISTELPKTFWNTRFQNFTPSYTMQPDDGLQYTGKNEGGTVDIEHFVPRDRKVLRRRLLSTYDARSSFVHAGKRDAMEVDAISTLAGRPNNSSKRPLDYLAVRRILRAMVLAEISSRSIPAPIPDIHLFHEAASAQRWAQGMNAASNDVKIEETEAWSCVQSE